MYYFTSAFTVYSVQSGFQSPSLNDLLCLPSLVVCSSTVNHLIGVLIVLIHYSLIVLIVNIVKCSTHFMKFILVVSSVDPFAIMQFTRGMCLTIGV